MRRILIISGVIITACAILLVGMNLNTASDGASCPESCHPFTGGAVREDDNLLLVIRHVHCPPSPCNSCGAYADSIKSVNVTVIPENGQQVFLEPSVRLYETTTIGGALAGRPNATVAISVIYAGWNNQTCNLKVMDKQV